MLYGKYTFVCRFETEAVLPRYKGSTFRGAFGQALRRITCALRRQECPDCILRQPCLYAHVFETELSSVSGDNPRISADPHPFVTEPPPESKTFYNRGDRFECDLLLFGDINKSLPYFVYAFERMGEFGLGKKGTDQRGCFTLVSVSCVGLNFHRGKLS